MAPISFSGEWKAVLLPELVGFTNLGLPATKFQQSEHNLFRLQVLKPLIIYVANPLVPQVDIQLDFLTFCVQSGAYLIGIEDKHPPARHPCTMIWPSSSMKHQRYVNHTCIPVEYKCIMDVFTLSL